jgi:hypothetical protein
MGEIDLDTIQEKIRCDLSFTVDEMLWLDELIEWLRAVPGAAHPESG